ncbi:hypothetical protein GCM10007053_29140 [Halioglobus pacificus]|uniref:UrcA family protein n=2 Tax=Parahalioglobus pacificus TaxID=930806 RepID=A0A919CLY5_9GAMM|nr:hypothetical protein GCM10007053_29140 [Halioglobus pacificus]
MTMKNVIRKTVAFAVLGISAGVAMTASAENYETTRVTTTAEGLQQAAIGHNDLDLTTVRGQEALYFRISEAAEQVCGSSHPNDAGGITQATENKICYQRVMSEAMAQLNANQVATINE